MPRERSNKKYTEELSQGKEIPEFRDIEHQIKNKIRDEIRKGLNKDKILNEEDRILFYKFYLKIKNEFKEIE